MQMRRIITSIVLALALLLLPLTDQAQQSSPDKPPAPAPAPSSAPKQEPAQKSNETIISVVNLVDVLFTVLNRRNKLVPELEKSDFKIRSEEHTSELQQSNLVCRLLLEKKKKEQQQSHVDLPTSRNTAHTSVSSR